jgi:hypothetical protein
MIIIVTCVELVRTPFSKRDLPEGTKRKCERHRKGTKSGFLRSLQGHIWRLRSCKCLCCGKVGYEEGRKDRPGGLIGDLCVRSWRPPLSKDSHATYHLISDMQRAGCDQHSVGCIPTTQRQVRAFPGGVTSRFGKAEEIADLMAYLVSPARKWMTGASVRMDGGEIKGI